MSAIAENVMELTKHTMEQPHTRRVLIQDRRTRTFLNGEQGWTAAPEQARDFHNSLSALSFCIQKGLLETQIVIKFMNPPAEDVVIPVQREERDFS